MPAEAPTAPPAEQAPKPAPQATQPTPSPSPAPPAQAQPAPTQREHPMSKVREGLRKAAERGPNPTILKEQGIKPEDAKAPEQPKEPERPKQTEPVKEPEKTEKTAEPEKTLDPSKETTSETTKDDEKPLGPWQQKQFWEKQAKEYERKNTELEQKLSSLGDLDELRQRAEKAESAAKELEEKIRYVDYSQSTEFKEKYEEPYNREWEKAAKQLDQIKVTDAEGNVRKATPHDLAQLSNMELSDAQELAEERFGKLAPYVMQMRDKIRDLYEKRAEALVEAQKTGSEKQRQEQELSVKAVQEAGKLWNEYKSADESEYDFLKEKDDDDEWNTLLNEKKQFVDTALMTNGTDRTMSPEERAKAVRNHAFIRGRAIGFSMRGLQIKRLQSEIGELKSQLSQYKQSEPGQGDAIPASNQQTTSPDPMERVRQAIRSRARESNVPYA